MRINEIAYAFTHEEGHFRHYEIYILSQCRAGENVEDAIDGLAWCVNDQDGCECELGENEPPSIRIDS